MDFFLGITNKCNLSCSWCAHQRLRNLEPEYEMTETEYNKFHLYTTKAGYVFNNLNINGLGEPTCHSDQKLVHYILIRSRKFSRNINLLSNGLNLKTLSSYILFVDSITISMWNTTKYYWGEIEKFQKKYESKVHLRYNIECHNLKEPYSVHKSTKVVPCGCFGPGYTMGTVFLVCGTWAPEIVKNNLYHTDLKEYYLDSLSPYIGTTKFKMCESCWANTAIPYEVIK